MPHLQFMKYIVSGTHSLHDLKIRILAISVKSGNMQEVSAAVKMRAGPLDTAPSERK